MTQVTDAEVYEVVERLKDLAKDRQSFFREDGDDEIFREDYAALQKAADILEQYREKEKSGQWFDAVQLAKIAMNLMRVKDLEQAAEDGRLFMLPYKPGTAFQQDVVHEYDIVFTGSVLYEIKSNEDTEYQSAEDLKETIRVAAESLAREKAEADPECPRCGNMPYNMEQCVICGQRFEGERLETQEVENEQRI